MTVVQMTRYQVASTCCACITMGPAPQIDLAFGTRPLAGRYVGIEVERTRAFA